MKNDFFSSAVVNGLLLGFVTIICTLLSSVLSASGGIAIVIWVVKLGTTVGLLYYFMKNYGSDLENYPYGSAFRYGFMVSLCSAIVVSLYLFLHYIYIFPNDIDKITQMMQQAMERSGEAEQKGISMIMNNITHFITVFYFLYCIILGVIISSILANFTKKVQPPFIAENE